MLRRDPRRVAAWFAAVGMTVAAAAALAADADNDWQAGLRYQDRSATAAREGDGYRLNSAGSERVIARGAASTTTASALFDALFALAQAELAQARVTQITDGAFNHGQPLACECLETGEKWTYVWTRDLAYATDLALFRFDPAHARNGLEFKLSAARAIAGATPADSGLYIVQDTGSGGSWPVSTDRIVWFLGARHLLGDAAFADKVYKALGDTLAQDRRYAFDAGRGLYRGETSFLDWREQTYPAWTAENVVFIAESYALSTNVLFHEALRLAERMARERHDRAAERYARAADALKAAIDRQFWRADRGLYMSYIGGAGAPRTIEAYDLLGTSLAIVSGIAAPARARRALANYPTWDAGSPVIWPERKDAAIYHNRAIWPFVSAYAMRAARKLDDAGRIAHELRSILRGAALAGSNMENYEFLTQAVHVEDGKHSGPVVNSRRQLWSVAAYLQMVVEGVFGLEENEQLEPKLPRELLPLLFGERDEIVLEMPGRRITLRKPPRLGARDNLLVAASVSGDPADRHVQLRGISVPQDPLPLGKPAFAPATPAKVAVRRDGGQWRIDAGPNDAASVQWYVNGRRAATGTSHAMALPYRAGLQYCISMTLRDAEGIESLPSEPVCVGDTAAIGGAWPRHWQAPASGRYEARIAYRNAHGSIYTGIAGAVKQLVVECAGAAAQSLPIAAPQNTREQLSTAATFAARAGQACTFALAEGFNMSALEHYSRYTGGEGGATGPVNSADFGELHIARVP